MLQILRNFEGFPDLPDRTLKRLRHKHGCFRRRHVNDELYEGALAEAEDVIRSNLESGQSAYYGISYNIATIRMASSQWVSRRDVAKITQQLDPQGVIARNPKKRNNRGRYSVKGPNRVWSVDGHDKLAPWGFAIYGMMDGFSRLIIDSSVGISNRTQVAVQARYIRAVRRWGFPKLIRSDKGSETSMLAISQVAFRRERNGPGLLFREAFHYGSSTKNIRIESWWNLLLKGQTRGWRLYFQTLTREGWFNGSETDKTCLRFLYMGTIRRHIQTFVEMHNVHNIRRQKSRAHYLPHGKPDELFYYPPPGCRNYISQPEGPLLEHFESQIVGYDPDLYIHPDTEQLCHQLISQRFENFDLEHMQFSPGLDQEHVQVYRFLREALYEYQEAGHILKEIILPRGAQEWISTMAEMQTRMAEIESERLAEERREEEDNIHLSEDEIEEIESEIGEDEEYAEQSELLYNPYINSDEEEEVN